MMVSVINITMAVICGVERVQCDGVSNKHNNGCYAWSVACTTIMSVIMSVYF